MLAIQDAICTGGLFYSMLNITESCIGVFQSFLCIVEPEDATPFAASRLLLSRLLIFIHQQYVEEGIASASDIDNTHLPDLETMDGILAALSLINMAELANVLHPDTYAAGVEPEERMFLMHVRKLGRHLLQWLNDHYLIEPASYPGDLISDDLEMPTLSELYFLHQAHALQSAVASMERDGFTPWIFGLTGKTLSTQLARCVGLEDLPEEVATFAWEVGTHKVTRRPTPLLSIFGMCNFAHSRIKLIE